MSRKTILVSVPLGLGAALLLWAAMAARGEPERKPANPVKPVARKPVPAETMPESSPSPGATPAGVAPAKEGSDHPLIRERIRKMEERLLTLEVQRNDLAVDNQDLERQLSEKQAESSARTMAEWRVRQWEQLLGLSETQKQQLLEVVTRWLRQDAGRPADRETWLSRELDLRARLSVEQSARLHDNATTQSRQMWSNLGRSIGGMIGASKDEQTRYQQTLGDFGAPNAMLLPEGYGADWPGMMREGSSRLQPLMSPDQVAKLNRFIQK